MAAPPMADDAVALRQIPAVIRGIPAQLNQMRLDMQELRAELATLDANFQALRESRNQASHSDSSEVRRMDTRSFAFQSVPNIWRDDSAASPQTAALAEQIIHPIRLISGHLECVNCGSNTHKMDRCLWAPNGLLEGCTICKSMSHLVDTGTDFQEMRLEKKIQVLVHSRCGLPALKTQSSWYEWFRLWLETRRPCGLCRIALPDGFPWSKQYAEDLLMSFDYARCLQEEFDEHQDISRLPKDPATRDMASVIRTFSTVEGDLI
ncbi:hypothetical protein FALBO_10673 [Fusarium albosuccineum]|uniref:Uncharacterized protein n=1 Tax=Fusarium albosuccineum TaxID=1237068 RepID=A0A8H4L6I4_9HYPO|nr:hypothetical protein FALBO_10673 [Fusarium albosuccineum]